MKAKVKYVKVGTIVEDQEWMDGFVSAMRIFCGQEFNFKHLVVSGKRKKNWFVISKEPAFSFHVSWLEKL